MSNRISSATMAGPRLEVVRVALFVLLSGLFSCHRSYGDLSLRMVENGTPHNMSIDGSRGRSGLLSFNGVAGAARWKEDRNYRTVERSSIILTSRSSNESDALTYGQSVVNVSFKEEKETKTREGSVKSDNTRRRKRSSHSQRPVESEKVERIPRIRRLDLHKRGKWTASVS